MDKQIIHLKLFDGRVIQFFDMNIKIYDNHEYYGTDKNDKAYYDETGIYYDNKWY